VGTVFFPFFGVEFAVFEQANLDRTIMENVVIVPGTACERLEVLTAKRKEQIAEFEEQVDNLEQQSRQLVYEP
jgi:hypothetical protein